MRNDSRRNNDPQQRCQQATTRVARVASALPGRRREVCRRCCCCRMRPAAPREKQSTPHATGAAPLVLPTTHSHSALKQSVHHNRDTTIAGMGPGRLRQKCMHTSVDAAHAALRPPFPTHITRSLTYTQHSAPKTLPLPRPQPDKDNLRKKTQASAAGTPAMVPRCCAGCGSSNPTRQSKTWGPARPRHCNEMMRPATCTAARTHTALLSKPPHHHTTHAPGP